MTDEQEILKLALELAEARAQIAAKDAALHWCRKYLTTEGYTRDGLVITRIDAALAAPARETE